METYKNRTANNIPVVSVEPNNSKRIEEPNESKQFEPDSSTSPEPRGSRRYCQESQGSDSPEISIDESLLFYGKIGRYRMKKLKRNIHPLRSKVMKKMAGDARPSPSSVSYVTAETENYFSKIPWDLPIFSREHFIRIRQGFPSVLNYLRSQKQLKRKVESHSLELSQIANEKKQEESSVTTVRSALASSES